MDRAQAFKIKEMPKYQNVLSAMKQTSLFVWQMAVEVGVSQN